MGKHIYPIGGKIFSFEPQRPVFYQLCANFCLNGLYNCFAHNLALGDRREYTGIPLLDIHRCINLGALSFDEEIRKEQGWDTSREQFEKVEMIKLDALSLQQAHLIKIDVEGLELEVIRGGLKFISDSNYPFILFEVWGDYMKNTIPKRNSLIHLLKQELGYYLYQWKELYVAVHKKRQNNKSEYIRLLCSCLRA